MAGGAKFATPGAPLADLQAAAAQRLLDAEVLLANGCFPSAIAMGIYSLEIHLKVKICQRLNLQELPRAFEIHELDGLLVLTGLHAARNSAPGTVQSNWEDITDLALEINDLRYLSPTKWGQSDAQTFFQKLRDPPDGVLPWLSAQP
jgi:hypothetical protein